MEPSDAELVSRIRLGDLSAWDVVTDRYGSDMQSAALRKLGGNRSAAEDAAQEAFRKLLEKTLPSVSNLRAYVITVTINTAIDMARKGDHEVPQQDFPEGADPQDVEEEVQRALLAARVREHMQLLGVKERIALQERVLKSRSAVDVGRQLEVTGQRVSQLVTSALEKLRPLVYEIESRIVDDSIEDGMDS
jgi:RNA polymerase sigma factor (sigma-70 family)